MAMQLAKIKAKVRKILPNIFLRPENLGYGPEIE
jgi:hypothetical protein